MLLPSIAKPPLRPRLQLRTVKELMEGKGIEASIHRRRHRRDLQESARIKEKSNTSKKRWEFVNSPGSSSFHRNGGSADRRISLAN